MKDPVLVAVINPLQKLPRNRKSLLLAGLFLLNKSLQIHLKILKDHEDLTLLKVLIKLLYRVALLYWDGPAA